MSDVATSILIVNFNKKDQLRALLTSLKMEEATTVEVIVIDNASFDGSREMVRAEFPRVRVIEMETNRGFAAAANKGIDQAAGDVAVLCHSDLVTTIHVLSELADQVREGRSRRVAGVAARVVAPDKTELPSAGTFPGLVRGIAGAFSPEAAHKRFVPSLDHIADHQYATTMCIALDLQVLSAHVGLFDPKFFLYYADADLSLRMHEKQYRILVSRRLQVIKQRPPLGEGNKKLAPHLARLMRKDQMHFYEKHRPGLQKTLVGLFMPKDK